jgi:hexosaminidase
MVNFPSIIPQLPRGLVAVPWWYEPDPDPEYKHWLDPLTAHGLPTFVAPGVNMWTEISPDFHTSFRNIDTFLAAGRRAHTLGLINTFWTDDQQALRRMAFPGMAYGAAAAWHGTGQSEQQFFSSYASSLYSAASAPHVASALAKLTDAETTLQKIWGKDTIQAIWSDPFSPQLLSKLRENRATLRQTRIAAEEAEEQLLSVPDFANEAATLQALLLGAQMLDYAGMKGLYAIELDELWQAEVKAHGQDEESWQLLDMAFGDMHGRTHDLLDSLSVLAPSYKENWLAEYAPYRMTTALARWDLEIAYWLRTEQRYAQFRKTYQKGMDLPPLHSIAREP